MCTGVHGVGNFMYCKAVEFDEISYFHNLVHFTQRFVGDALFIKCFFIGLIHHNNIWKLKLRRIHVYFGGTGLFYQKCTPDTLEMNHGGIGIKGIPTPTYLVSNCAINSAYLTNPSLFNGTLSIRPRN
jgi:hypothetical protein